MVGDGPQNSDGANGVSGLVGLASGATVGPDGIGVVPLARRLALVDVGGGRFRSAEPVTGPHVFGGLLVGQALRAAALTLGRDQPARSLHASFLAAGRPGAPLIHRVERSRDGNSFSTRRVEVTQDGRAVLVLTADFHREEEGAEYEAPGPAGVPGPDGLGAGRYDNPWIEFRDVPVDDGPDAPAHARWAWFRLRAPLPADPALHQHVLAYLSDHGPTRAVRQPHAHLEADDARQSVSLDHSVWFHRPVHFDDGWFLSELAPVATGRGRGLAVGSIRRPDGALVATVAQEVLLRHRR